jgi:serine/threonine-protein kinase RsbT
MYPVMIPIFEEVHAIVAAQHGRALAQKLGFNVVDQTALCTAILEVARNIVKYAERGEIVIAPIANHGVEIIARDTGPGIVDIPRAMENGFSTGNSLGLGLPGAKRLMNSFEIESQAGQGTHIVMRKYPRGY